MREEGTVAEGGEAVFWVKKNGLRSPYAKKEGFK